MRPFIYSLLAMASLAGCEPEQNVNQLFPEITVAPPELHLRRTGRTFR